MTKKSVFFIVGILFLFTACEKTFLVEPATDITIAAIGPDKIKLSWAHPHNAAYSTLIERKLTSDNDDSYMILMIVDGTHPSYREVGNKVFYEIIDKDLKPGTSYTYKLTTRYDYIINHTIYISKIQPTVSATTLSIADLPNISIGTQIWQSKNLDVTTYRNGDAIPQITNITDWKAARTGAWCYYNFDDANGTTYGKIYNQYAVDDARGLAPQGWRIPTSNDYYALRDFLGGKSAAGQKMKSTTLWKTTTLASAIGSNESKWNGLPGGRVIPGTLPPINEYSYFWTSTDSTFDSKKSRNSVFLYYGTGEMYAQTDTSMNMGNYVRCIRN